MNTPDNKTCKRCGAAIPSQATERLCPACLMSIALVSPGDRTETQSLTPGESLALYGYTDLPCDFGGYHLFKLLGRGGMGAVYEAQQIATGWRVALKMLARQLDSPDMRQRFLREGRLAAGINHPNSLYVFGSEEIDDLPVITMEIAAGGTLKDKLKERGPLPVAEAVDAILEVISGLEATFVGGILHRDIKPSNCFVNPDGSVKVGDFGLSVSTLAKTDTFVTAHGKIMGTPAYASPEQLRGDALDLRADIYSVGATLFTLLTNEAPFDGDNAVQVVANAVNQKPKSLTTLRPDIPPDLDRIITRCLAKEPAGRYPDYQTLRNALLPFSSKEPEPASIIQRVSAGWIDYLIAFMVPYILIMLFVGANQLIVRPLVDRTLYSARYYFALLGFGFLYFTITEGLWGAGLGKFLKGLQIVRVNGRRPGFFRALIRIVIPILCVETVRMPLMLALIHTADWTPWQTSAYVLAAIICGWIPVTLALLANPKNNYATLWDTLSGTQVRIKPKGALRPAIKSANEPDIPAESATTIGPYQILKTITPDQWLLALDPVLRRQVWLIRQNNSPLTQARQNLARPGRLRWLQNVHTPQATWNACEATEGLPFTQLIAAGKHLPWASLRFWLHDLASELWESSTDHTLPAELGLDHIWITTQGRAILLDEPWPASKSPTPTIPIDSLTNQQRFLHTVAAGVDPTTLPLHARGVLKNLADGKFEKLSFLTGILRTLLDQPVELNRGLRAGSVLLLPGYVWTAVMLGYFHDKPDLFWNNPMDKPLSITLAILGVFALIQLLSLPLGSTPGHHIFRLAIIDSQGRRATLSRRFKRWAAVWLPLFIPCILFLTIFPAAPIAAITLILWLCAVIHTITHPHRSIPDQLAATWVVRQ